MKSCFWTKIVAASLLILGEGAFASESNEHADDSYESNGNAIQLSLSAVLDDAGSMSQPSLSNTHSTQPSINHATQLFTAVTTHVSDLLKHHPFSPRAPPTPAD